MEEHKSARIVGFCEKVDVCGLYDLGYEGRKWTFEKKVAGGVLCHVRLDRALATADWRSCFPLARVTHLTTTALDRDPVLLYWDLGERERRENERKMFGLEWMRAICGSANGKGWINWTKGVQLHPVLPHGGRLCC